MFPNLQQIKATDVKFGGGSKMHKSERIHKSNHKLPEV